MAISVPLVPGLTMEPVIERIIPRTGERVPIVGLGTWRTFDVGAADYERRVELLRRFVGLGGRVVDSSPMYGRSEAVVGALAARLELHSQLFLATKVWTEGRTEGIVQMQASLEKLRTARIDLMQVHNLVDADTHLETLVRWKADGKLRYIGVTHYTVESHRLLERFVRRPEIDFVQCNYSLASRGAEERLLPLAAEHGVATLINRPFENGDVFAAAAGKRVPDVGRALQCTTWAQLFLKYVMAHPAVTCVIPATSNVGHLEDNMAAGHEPLPDPDQCAAIVRAWHA